MSSINQTIAENIAAIVVDERVKEEVRKRGIQGKASTSASGHWAG